MFDQFIDDQGNDDVDIIEFRHGLRKMGIKSNTLSDHDIDTIFELLLCSDDDDDDGDVIQKQIFSDFLTRRFDAPQLIQFQECLVLNIAGVRILYICVLIFCANILHSIMKPYFVVCYRLISPFLDVTT